MDLQTDLISIDLYCVNKSNGKKSFPKADPAGVVSEKRIGKWDMDVHATGWPRLSLAIRNFNANSDACEHSLHDSEKVITALY